MLNSLGQSLDGDIRVNCKMRHENGNCLPCGGFCTAVSNGVCCALHNAYNHGFFDCHEIIQKGKTKTDAKVSST